MNIQLQKLEIIEWLVSLQDEQTILSIKKIKISKQKDWWDDLLETEKEAVNFGLKDAEEGKLTTHNQVKKVYEKWL